MSLTACYVVYEEADSLARSMLSVKAYVDRYVVVEGAFASNPGPLRSRDATREVAERAAEGRELTYIEPQSKLEEHSSRQAYLEAVELGGWALIMDGDEVLVGEHGDLVAMRESLEELEEPALQLRVYTTAVLAPLLAPQISPALFDVAPRIATSGYMTRLFRRTSDLRHVKLEMAPGQYSYGGLANAHTFLGSQVPHCEAGFLINDHAGQSHAGYLADYAWETAQGGIT